jgi:hypothetical protein
VYLRSTVQAIRGNGANWLFNGAKANVSGDVKPGAKLAF